MDPAAKSSDLNALCEVGDRGGGNILEPHKNKPGLRRTIFRAGQRGQIGITKRSICSAGSDENFDIVCRLFVAVVREELEKIKPRRIERRGWIAGEDCSGRIGGTGICKRFAV